MSFLNFYQKMRKQDQDLSQDNNVEVKRNSQETLTTTARQENITFK